MLEITDPYTSRIYNNMHTLERLLCEVDYHHLNNCKIEDVIMLLETLRELMDDPYQKVRDLLRGFGMKMYPIIYLHSNNRRWDLGDCDLENINDMISILYKAQKDGLVYLYESINYRVEEGL